MEGPEPHFIEDEEVIEKTLSLLGLWEVKVRSPQGDQGLRFPGSIFCPSFYPNPKYAAGSYRILTPRAGRSVFEPRKICDLSIITAFFPTHQSEPILARFSVESSRFFVTVLRLFILMRLTSYTRNKDFGPMWIWTKSCPDGKINLL